jgi:hypothetical protein
MQERTFTQLFIGYFLIFSLSIGSTERLFKARESVFHFLEKASSYHEKVHPFSLF